MASGAPAGTAGHGRDRGTFLATEPLLALLQERGLDPSLPQVEAAVQRFAAEDGSGVHVPTGEAGNILTKAIRDKLAVPNWQNFRSTCVKIFEDIRANVHGGSPADYIPILSKQDPDWFSMSVCTVDGQRFDYGDTDKDFSIQSCIKPLVYGIGVEDNGLEIEHKHVGIEPSGLAFNEVSLNADGLPHNPMVNAGAIAAAGLLGRGMEPASRFKYLLDRLQDMAGGERPGFCQTTYLSEYETAWRNNALLYHMEEHDVFPADVSPEEVLDTYIQCCAIEVNTRRAAAMAAMLAGGGVAATTGKRCLSPGTVKSVLTLMLSCGMYDFSGSWVVHVGLPAKSGVAGLVYCVIPQVAGIALYSPPLDSHGNSVRAVEFFRRLLQRYNYSIFDKLVADGLTRLPLCRSPTELLCLGHGGTPPPALPGLTLAAAPATPAPLGDIEHMELTSFQLHEEGGTEARAVIADAATDAHVHHVALHASMMLPLRRLAAATRVWSLLGKWVAPPEALGVAARCLAALPAPGESLCLPDSGHPCRTQPLIKVLAFLASQGIVVDVEQNPIAARALQELPRTSDGRVALADLFKPPNMPSGAFGALVMRALQNKLMVRDFHVFSEDVARMARCANLLFELGADGFADDASLASGQAGDGASVGGAADARGKHTTIYSRKLNQRGDASKGYDALQSALNKAYTELALDTTQRPTSASSSTGHGTGTTGGDLPPASPVPLLRAVSATVQEELDGAVGDEDDQEYVRMTLASLGVTRSSLSTRAAGSAPNAHRASEEAIRSLLRESDVRFDDHFVVSVCTVDGQQFTAGNTSEGCTVHVPLMETVKPLLYAMALQHAGLADTQAWVSAEPTSSDPASFDLLAPVSHGGKDPGPPPPPKPYNPFTLSGALAVAALVGKGHCTRADRMYSDGGGRFELVRNTLSKWAGGSKVGFNNPAFLALKRTARQTMAVSHYMKGQGCYPARTDPTNNVHFYSQCMSVTMSPQQIANMAGMLANAGVAPTTWEPCLHPTTTKQLLSLMYSCGMNAYGGKWNFNVGVPSATGSTGVLMAVIPGVAGMCIFSPRMNEHNVPIKGLRLAEMLVRRYHLNLIDSMVNAEHVKEESAGKSGATWAVDVHKTVAAFELCTAANQGDLKQVSDLLVQGAAVNHQDYDKRTALHVAACEGHGPIVRELLKAGADPCLRDRWGYTPLDEARRRGYRDLAVAMEFELLAAGVPVPEDPLDVELDAPWTSGVAAGSGAVPRDTMAASGLLSSGYLGSSTSSSGAAAGTAGRAGMAAALGAIAAGTEPHPPKGSSRTPREQPGPAARRKVQVAGHV